MQEPFEAKPIKKRNVKLAWAIVVLALIYTISPIDIVPDAPIIGWIDDAAVDLLAVLNLVRKYMKTVKSN
ncbi:MAG: DUF1232 domain-containing protein [Endomicrobium sp.]|jgi:uncharacterized membrane protein YkvA (DUF1232 family)|nr:DUF1232 domain-containing protein [Endomicrobium sp.]